MVRSRPSAYREGEEDSRGGRNPSRQGLHGGGRYSRRLVGRIPDRRGHGGGSDPAEARHACDLRFMYTSVRSPAPCGRGVLIVRGDRSSPRGMVLGIDTPDPAVGGGRTKSRLLVYARSTAKHGEPCNEPSRRRRGGLGLSFWPASTPIPGAPLQDGIEQTPSMGASCNGGYRLSVPGGGSRYPIPGSGERGRWQVRR